MGGRFSPIIIIALIAIVGAIGFLIFEVVTKDPTQGPSNDTVVSEVITPVLSLEKNYNESMNSVTIKAQASIEDPMGIKEIILPDKSKMAGDEAEFIVEENGNFEFSAVAMNGKIETLSIEVTEIREASSTNPYIPEGFEEVGGTIEEGYVITDKYGNQYVWVPVPSGKLTRATILDMKYEENNTTASALVNSVAKYYGFYIGRFEASEYDIGGKLAAATMSGKVPWTQITYLQAAQYANNAADVFGYTDCETSLLNSYAWDTTIEWIDKTYSGYSSSSNYGNYDGTILPTGSTESDKVNNICDLAGNVREWTTEVYKGSTTSASKNKNDKDTQRLRVIRGGGASLSTTPKSHIGYAEDASDPFWGFRTVLYK